MKTFAVINHQLAEKQAEPLNLSYTRVPLRKTIYHLTPRHSHVKFISPNEMLFSISIFPPFSLLWLPLGRFPLSFNYENNTCYQGCCWSFHPFQGKHLLLCYLECLECFCIDFPENAVSIVSFQWMLIFLILPSSEFWKATVTLVLPGLLIREYLWFSSPVLNLCVIRPLLLYPMLFEHGLQAAICSCCNISTQRFLCF